MTEQEQRKEFEQKQQEYFNRLQQEQIETQRKLQQAQRQAADVQNEINNRPQRKYAAIVAVDLRGGFSKDGQIPWYYAADFKWFQNKTKGNVCVMGRTTYDDINKRLGEKAATAVLPGRKTFVVTSRPLERDNAVAIAGLEHLDFALDKHDIPYDQTVYFCGGERIYTEGMSKCNVLHVTVVNKEVGADKFFPLYAIDKLGFTVNRIEAEPSEPDLKFVTYAR